MNNDNLYFKSEFNKKFHICEKCNFVKLIIGKDDGKECCDYCGNEMETHDTLLKYYQSCQTATVSC